MRLYVNYFQPSFQLLTKRRNGGSVTKRYSKPATPCDRLLARDDVSGGDEAEVEGKLCGVGPGDLAAQHTRVPVCAGSGWGSRVGGHPDGDSLESFLSQLPELLRQGEVRPTHARRARGPHTWRTQPDPFEGVWCEVLSWLQQQPDTAAADLMDRLNGATRSVTAGVSCVPYSAESASGAV